MRERERPIYLILLFSIKAVVSVQFSDVGGQLLCWNTHHLTGIDICDGTHTHTHTHTHKSMIHKCNAIIEKETNFSIKVPSFLLGTESCLCSIQ